MLRGLYTAAAGMLVQQLVHDTVANNLANAATAGYRRDTAVLGAFPGMLLRRTGESQPVGWPARSAGMAHALRWLPTPGPWIGALGTGAGLDEVRADMTPGRTVPTGNSLDVAIDGEGFFVVETPAGARYTRAGSWRLDAAGWLVTPDGHRVLGEAGPLQVPPGTARLEIDQEGRVVADGQVIGRLEIVTFPNVAALEKQGGTLFRATPAAGAPAASAARVLQGFLERSNVNPVREMVDMIAATRVYEANQKAVHAQDTLLEKAVNEVGRTA